MEQSGKQEIFNSDVFKIYEYSGMFVTVQMESIQHLEYMYQKAMCLEKPPPSPPPSTDSGVIVNDDGEGLCISCR